MENLNATKIPAPVLNRRDALYIEIQGIHAGLLCSSVTWIFFQSEGFEGEILE